MRCMSCQGGAPSSDFCSFPTRRSSDLLSEVGIVIDLRRMSSVEVDPAACTPRVAGGATWSHIDRACQPHALATTGGDRKSTRRNSCHDYISYANICWKKKMNIIRYSCL